MSIENIVNHLPLKFMKWWTENVEALELNKDYIDIQTGMKSHLHIKFHDGKYYAYMRYNTIEQLDTFQDLHSAVRDCEHGRDFMNSNIVEFYRNGFPEELSWEKFE